ncbi:nuclear transport factor 2 family protein [Bradyrhizobium sp. 2TAF24]|uniref:nuclear transport factor 2 family protein n=1 Tax=Bradyrhizobium sp. 2TAF24 TaxID=3233011 RepID=UPI003F90DC2A
MTTTDIRQTLQAIFDGLAKRDGTLFIDTMADDIIWTIIGNNSWSGVFRGKEEVLRDLLMPLRALLAERSRTVASRIIVDGDFAAVEARGHNVTKTGRRYDNQYCFTFRFAGDRIAEVTEYSDTELIVSALGDRMAVMAAKAD